MKTPGHALLTALAGALAAATLAAIPASATDIPGDAFSDPVGDAPARADLTWGRVWYPDSPAAGPAYATGPYSTTVRVGVRDVRASGRYEVYLGSDYDIALATVVKEAGKAPRAWLAVKAYGDTWHKRYCQVPVAWDTTRNYVSVMVSKGCDLWGTEHVTAPFKIRYSSLGAADVARP